jgi:hypothetical protein
MKVITTLIFFLTSFATETIFAQGPLAAEKNTEEICQSALAELDFDSQNEIESLSCTPKDVTEALEQFASDEEKEKLQRLLAGIKTDKHDRHKAFSWGVSM